MKTALKILTGAVVSTATAVALSAAPVAALADPGVIAGLKHQGETTYSNEILMAQPGEIVEGQMHIRNLTGDKVFFGIGLATSTNLSFVNGSALVWNRLNENGSPLGNIDGVMTNIGLHSEYDGQGKGESSISYQIKVAEKDQLLCGTNTYHLVNTVAAYEMVDKPGSTTGEVIAGKLIADPQDVDLAITVTGNSCETPGKPADTDKKPAAELPTTGPAAVITGITGVAALTTAGAYYIISRKK